MAEVRSYRDLLVWQRAMDIAAATGVNAETAKSTTFRSVHLDVAAAGVEYDGGRAALAVAATAKGIDRAVADHDAAAGGVEYGGCRAALAGYSTSTTTVTAGSIDIGPTDCNAAAGIHVH